MAVKPKGGAGCTSRAVKSLLPEVQGKVRASHGQRVFQRVSGACRRDRNALHVSPAKPALPLFRGLHRCHLSLYLQFVVLHPKIVMVRQSVKT